MGEKEEKRSGDRKPVALTSYVRRELPDGGRTLMQFLSKDLSKGGIFVSSEDLTILDLDEEVDVIVEQNKERFFEGRARIVRSVRVFQTDDRIIESGFGLMFLAPDNEFTKMVEKELTG